MTINSLKDLKKLIQLCRKMGIEAIEVGDIKMNLGAAPTVIYKTKKSDKKSTTLSDGVENPISTDGLTEEQLLMWSVQGPQLEAPPEQQ